MTKRITSSRCPWPGPRPYEESETKYFRGRQDDLEELIYGHVRGQAVTVLISTSGTGKTSLLQAGLIPELRYQREEEIKRGDKVPIGIALMLRSWGKPGNVSQIIVEAIQKEIKRLGQQVKTKPITEAIPRGHRQLKKDLKIIADIENLPELRNITKADDVVQYLGKLCDGIGKLVLVIDQAEELLGSGFGHKDENREQEVQNILGKIFKHEKSRVTLVISLREEYSERLRELDKDIDNIDGGRKYHLKPMKPQTLEKALSDSVDLLENEYIKKRLDATIIRRLVDIASCNKQIDMPKTGVELLNIQALLVELYNYVKIMAIAVNLVKKSKEPLKALQESKKTRVLFDGLTKTQSEELITELKLGETRNIIEGLRRSLHVKNDNALVSGSLQRYISNIFDDIPNSQRRDLIKYVAARFVSDFSSPAGFKRHVEMTELLVSALKQDLANLATVKQAGETTEENIVKRLPLSIRRYEKTHDIHDIDVDFLFGKFAQSPKKPRDLRSGTAIVKDWSLEQTAQQLVKAVFDAIELLRRHDHNIIKSSGVTGKDKGGIYEIVHDGFGTALREWAKSIRRQPQDTLASVVARRGEDFPWQKLSSDKPLKGLNWLGCCLDYTKISNVHFINCDFSGCIFSGCTLMQCTFTNCDLRGTLFQGGKWETVKLENCNAPAIYLGEDFLHNKLKWDGVVIRNSVLDQMILVGVEPYNKNELNACQIRLANIVDLDVEVKKPGTIAVTDSDLFNTIVSDLDKNTWQLRGVGKSIRWTEPKDTPADKYDRSLIGKSIGRIWPDVQVKNT